MLEYDEALDRRVKQLDFPVVLLLLEGQTAPGLPFLRQLHWIDHPRRHIREGRARLVMDAAAGSGAPPGELWRYTSPYRGLAAMDQNDSGLLLRQGGETVDVIGALAATPDQLPVVLGNSGVGKSSLAQAGVLAALKRQAWPEGGGRRAVAARLSGEPPLVLSHAQARDRAAQGAGRIVSLDLAARRDRSRAGRTAEWLDRAAYATARPLLRDLLDATERRYRGTGSAQAAGLSSLCRPGRGAVRARRGAPAPPVFGGDCAGRCRSASVHADEHACGFSRRACRKTNRFIKVHRKINVPPLREAELREVVSRPAELLSARFETAGLADIITRRTAEDSVKDVGALPLLSYTLDDMWTQMVKRGDGVLRLPAQSFELGGVLVDRADTFLAAHPKSRGRASPHLHPEACHRA